ncbi:hypothetical protein [Helicobacter sp. 23-1045]
MRESYGTGGNYAKAKGEVDFYKIAESALKSLQDSAIRTKNALDSANSQNLPTPKPTFFIKSTAKIKFAESSAIFCHFERVKRAKNLENFSPSLAEGD